MGMLDSFSGVCMVLGGIYTAGGTQILLQQMAIPMTLILSVFILRKSYDLYQWVG